MSSWGRAGCKAPKTKNSNGNLRLAGNGGSDSCGVRTHALADWRLEPAL